MQDNLTELMSARICHDLISPVGAIGNGIELVNELSGSSPELDLVSQSANAAQAKLKFFRLAFGASNGTQIGGPEAQRIASDMFSTGRVTVTFDEPWGSRQRNLVKLLYQLLLCIETSLPRGGNIKCTPTISGWDISISNTPVNVETSLWAHISGNETGKAVTAKTIQFFLAKQSILELGMTITIDFGANNLRVTF